MLVMLGVPRSRSGVGIKIDYCRLVAVEVSFWPARHCVVGGSGWCLLVVQ